MDYGAIVVFLLFIIALLLWDIRRAVCGLHLMELGDKQAKAKTRENQNP